MSLAYLLCIKYITIPYCLQNKVLRFQNWRLKGPSLALSSLQSSLCHSSTLYTLGHNAHTTLFSPAPCAWSVSPSCPSTKWGHDGTPLQTHVSGSLAQRPCTSQLLLCVTASLDLLHCRVSQYICPSLPHKSQLLQAKCNIHFSVRS